MPVVEDTAAERAKNASRHQPRPPKGVSLTENYLNLPCESAKKDDNGNTVVLNIHGGGFTTGSARENRALSFYICDKLDIIALHAITGSPPNISFPRRLTIVFSFIENW